MEGMVKAIERGFPQREIAKAAFEYQKRVEKRERIVVGVNDFVLKDEEIEIPILKVDPEVEKEQHRRLKELRQKRDNQKVKRALDDLRDGCRSNVNLMYPILEATRAYATLGEICGVMREEFGEYREPIIF